MIAACFPMDEEFFVPLLPKLTATRVSMSKELILQLAVTALKLTTSQSIHYEEDDAAYFSILQIHVPPEIRIARLVTTSFAGEYSPTKEEAIESASCNSLLYMQSVNIVIIDDLKLHKLVKCQKDLVQSKSWAGIFEHETVRLKQKVAALQREIMFLKEGTALNITVENNTGTNQPKQENNYVEVAPLSSDEEHGNDDANKQHMLFGSIKNKSESSICAIEKHGHPSTIQQVSTTPYEYSDLITLGKEDTQSEEPLPEARSPLNGPPSMNVDKDHGNTVRRPRLTSYE